MFKVWQVFMFSLIPLALVFAGVIGGSMHGLDSSKEVFPTPAPRSGSGGPTSGGAAGAVTSGTALRIVAKDQKFNTTSLSAPAQTSVTVTLDNQDGGTLHNFSVYTTKAATTKIYVSTDYITGPATKDYSFTTPIAGSYFFRCDVHPDTMNGTFTVR